MKKTLLFVVNQLNHSQPYPHQGVFELKGVGYINNELRQELVLPISQEIAQGIKDKFFSQTGEPDSNSPAPVITLTIDY